MDSEQLHAARQNKFHHIVAIFHGHIVHGEDGGARIGGFVIGQRNFQCFLHGFIQFAHGLAAAALWKTATTQPRAALAKTQIQFAREALRAIQIRKQWGH